MVMERGDMYRNPRMLTESEIEDLRDDSYATSRAMRRILSERLVPVPDARMPRGFRLVRRKCVKRVSED